MASSNVCWGIEVGSGAVKGLKLERDGEQVKVVDFVSIEHKKVLSTPDLDRAEATRLALGALMSQYRDAMRGTTIAVSIPGHSAFARFAKLPPVDPKGVANLVRFEAVQQIPFPIDQVEWDYQTFATSDSPDVEVGIFAVTRERINEILAVYGEAGLTPDIINLSPVAVYNAVAYDLAFTEKTPGTVILDIGTTATDLVVADSGKVWVRTFPLGGHNFTEALASAFKLTYAKAEKLKREAETSKYKRHIFQAMKPVLSELVQDVQRSIGYYQDTHPEAKLTRLVGCGSTFKLLGLRKLLSQQLRLEVYRLERFKRLSVDGPGGADFEAATPNFATAYGLALQGLGLNTINANLMPVQVIREAMWKGKTRWFLTAAGLGIAAGALSFVRPFLDNMAVQSAQADPAVTGPVNATISKGNQLKNEWQTASSGKQPGFVAENMMRLTEGRELFPSLVSDVGVMVDAANTHGSAGGAGKPLIAEARRFSATYIAPGGALPKGGAPVEGAGGGGGGSGGGFGGGGDREAHTPPPAPEGGTPAAEGAGAALEAAQAGAAGAVRLTLVVDVVETAQERGIPFVNDTFLAWLKTNAQRKDVGYTYINLPKAVEVTRQQLAQGTRPTDATSWGSGDRGTTAPAQSGGDRERPAPPPPPPQNAGKGFGIPEDAKDDRPNRPPPPQPTPPASGGRTPTRSSGPEPMPSGGDIDKLAPLPTSLRPPLPNGTVYRYTIVWYAQIQPPKNPGEGGEAPASSASAGGTAHHAG